MMTKNADKKREQMMMFSMDDMVPQNHMLRLIDKAINWNLFMIWLKKNIVRITVAPVWIDHADKDTIYPISLWNKKHAPRP